MAFSICSNCARVRTVVQVLGLTDFGLLPGAAVALVGHSPWIVMTGVAGGTWTAEFVGCCGAITGFAGA
jgi:hypothetical protein